MLNSRNLAVIGAILTIVAMAVDPFTQQIVHVYSCSRAVDGESAIVPFSNNYTAGFWSEALTDPQLDPQLLSAIYIGLLDPLANASAAVQFQCRTGNCTFPSADDGATFLSLALESRCTDIGSGIAFSIDVDNRTASDNTTHYTARTSARLPDYDLHLDNSSLLLPEGHEVMQSGETSPGDGLSLFLSKVSYLMTDRDHPPVPQYTYAFECEFYPAVNTYSANITNGVLLEQVLESQRMEVWSGYPVNSSHFDSPNTHALLIVDRTIREGNWNECTSSLVPSDEHNLPVIIRLDPLSEGSQICTSCPPEALASPWNNITWWPQDCVYWLPFQVVQGLSAAISDLLGNNIVSYGPLMIRASGNLWSVKLWNNGTPTLDIVQATMDGMTRSITARFRQGDGISVNMGPANGTVWEMQTCVGVNWEWLALPAGLLLLTVVFLVLTIIRTSSKQARVWKSSIFAVLFSGLDQETRKSDRPVLNLEDMKAAAGRAMVRLEDTKDGFRLVGQV